jgi:gliding motility-associated-like protein
VIKILLFPSKTLYFCLFFLCIHQVEASILLDSFKENKSYAIAVELLQITTTSNSAVWRPSKVTTGGEILEWKASASGMTDQIFQTNGIPVFDLSVDRTSQVTITATTTNGNGNLTELIINSLNITSLNLTNSLNLKTLSCTDNQITNLDIQNNTLLTELFCHSNQLSGLNVSQNVNLSVLACFSNQIPEIELSNNVLLSSLSCNNNLLQNLDLSNSTQLIALECEFNQLQDLNVQNGNNTLIQKISTKNNSNLFCIQVDDVVYAENNWTDIDPWTQFNKDCTFTNEPPIAVDDFYEMNENATLDVDVLQGVLVNDIDPDDDILMAILKTNVSNGELELFPDGSFIYTPTPGFYGTDTFTYAANDGEFDSNIALVTIEVFLVNSPPITEDNSYLTEENIELIVDVANGVLSNDTDPDEDPLSAELISDVSYGDLMLLPNGAFTYSPDLNFNGTDGFSYRAFDGLVYSKETFVTIIVEAKVDMVVPNAFTPNNDDLNDTFRPVYKGMSNVEISVYDTWGNLIYTESGKTLKGWDGYIGNNAAENGNYLYRILATSHQQEEIKEEGIFTLIK